MGNPRYRAGETMGAKETTAKLGKSGQYLSFSLGHEDYGVDILRVKEIKGWEAVRSLPDTPEYIKGVLDLRGVIVPIIDLRSRFKLPHVDYTSTTVTIVMTIISDNREHVIGMVVDGVSDVLDVSMDEMKAVPSMGRYISAEYISGMVKHNERIIVLLDTDRLFDLNELSMLEVLE